MTEKEPHSIDKLKEIYYGALKATDPEPVTEKNVVLIENQLRIAGESFPLDKYRKIFLAGVGTAAFDIASRIEGLLGDKINQGLILVPPGYGGKLENIKVREVTSPLMDRVSKQGLRDLLFLIGGAQEEDLIILILTKGSTEILESLPDKITLADYNLLVKRLLTAGALEEEINAIKMHISQIKGGQFIVISYPATLVTLIISDEPGGDIRRTYLAPTYPDPKTFEYCRRTLIRYRLPMKLPPSILNYFNLGIRKKIPETVKNDDERLLKVFNFVIEDSSTFAAAALEESEKLGFSTSILSTNLEGRAEQLGGFFGSIIGDIAEFGIPMEPPSVFIASGKLERSEGRRLEEMCVSALSCATKIEGIENAYFLAGTSFHYEKGGFSGCIVSGDTVEQVRNLGIEPIDLIRQRQAHKILGELKLLLNGKFNQVDCGDLYIMMVA